MKKTIVKRLRKAVARRRGRSIAKAQIPAHTRELYTRLRNLYPDAHVELDYSSPLELLIATILSAQCTDKRVNMVTPLVFKAFPTAQSLADANPAVMEGMIKSTGFFRNKTKSLIALGKALVERHNVKCPTRWRSWSNYPALVARPPTSYSAMRSGRMKAWSSTPTLADWQCDLASRVKLIP
jgi:endonuclease III